MAWMASDEKLLAPVSLPIDTALMTGIWLLEVHWNLLTNACREKRTRNDVTQRKERTKRPPVQ